MILSRSLNWGAGMQREKDYWIETEGRTLLYYRVRARSRKDAVAKYSLDKAEYVGCTDEPSQHVVRAMDDPPYIQWKE
jgi:hypothetical protein